MVIMAKPKTKNSASVTLNADEIIKVEDSNNTSSMVSELQSFQKLVLQYPSLSNHNNESIKLFEMVVTEIKILGYEVYDSFSDNGAKFGIGKNLGIKKVKLKEGKSNEVVMERLKIGWLCEFAVNKNCNSEQYIIWDDRINHPLENDVCEGEMPFGRYHFFDMGSFLNYLKQYPYSKDNLRF
jgi:hypothetical protein